MANPQAYLKRRTALEKAAALCQPGLLKTSYQWALARTDECLVLCNALLERAAEAHAIIRRFGDQRTAQLTAQLADIADRQNALSKELMASLRGVDDQSRALISTRLMAVRNEVVAQTVQVQTARLVDGLQTLSVTAVPTLVENLFTNIIAPDESQFKLNAVVYGLDVLIGAIPFIGNLYSGARGVFSIVTSRRTAVVEADRQFRYLQEYCYALSLWEAAAQGALGTLDFLVDAA